MNIQFSTDEKTITIDGKLYYRPVQYPQSYNAGRVFNLTPYDNVQSYLTSSLPGDVIYLGEGSYNTPLTCPVAGTAVDPIVLSCAPGALGKVIIAPPVSYFQSNIHGSVITISKNYVLINGLVIVGGLNYPGITTDVFGANGITWQSGGGFGKASNCVIYGPAHCGIKEMGHGGTNITAEGNIIFSCGQTSQDHGIYMGPNNCKLNGNLIFDCAGAGLHLYSNPSNLTIQGNVIWGNKNWGILLGSKNSTIQHNTIVGNKTGLMYFRDKCTGNYVNKNIICFNTTNVSADAGNGTVPPTGNTDSQNCYYPNFEVPLGMESQFETEINIDPKFINQSLDDYRLQPGRPAVESIPFGAF